MSQIKDNNIIVDGLKVYYKSGGSLNRRQLVFLHGWAARDDGFMGTPRNESVIRELAEHFRVFGIELPGLIRSEPPKKAWRINEYSRFINKLLKKLKLNKPFIMGQSFGGGVATVYAEMFQSEISGLIIVDATHGDRINNLYFKLRDIWNPFFGKLMQSSAPFSIKKLLSSVYLGTPFKFITKENIKSYGVMADTQIKSLVFTDYKKFKIPVVMVWGKGDTFITPIKRAREITKVIPNSKLIEVDGGHTILYKKPKYVVDKIVEGLENV